MKRMDSTFLDQTVGGPFQNSMNLLAIRRLSCCLMKWSRLFWISKAEHVTDWFLCQCESAVFEPWVCRLFLEFRVDIRLHRHIRTKGRLIVRYFTLLSALDYYTKISLEVNIFVQRKLLNGIRYLVRGVTFIFIDYYSMCKVMWACCFFFIVLYF